MKKLMMGLALAALAVTPALANGNQARASNAWDQNPGYNAYDYAPGQAYEAYDAVPGAPPVFAAGKYVGSDPDPFIRSQLLRDPPGLTN